MQDEILKEQSEKYIKELLQNYPRLEGLENELRKAIVLLKKSIIAGGTIFVCGNGGSAADAEHIVGELVKSFLKKRPIRVENADKIKELFPNKAEYLIGSLEEGIKSFSLVSGVSLPTAYANDVAADMVFAQQVYVQAKKSDILWGISTSGNSKNVNNALMVAKALGCSTLGFSGKTGGEMAELLDVELRVPLQSTPAIQELHLPLYHCICAVIEEELF